MGSILLFELVNGLITGAAALRLVLALREQSGRDLPSFPRPSARPQRAPGA